MKKYVWHELKQKGNQVYLGLSTLIAVAVGVFYANRPAFGLPAFTFTDFFVSYLCLAMIPACAMLLIWSKAYMAFHLSTKPMGKR